MTGTRSAVDVTLSPALVTQALGSLVFPRRLTFDAARDMGLSTFAGAWKWIGARGRRGPQRSLSIETVHSVRR